jgi:hypothetical protein
MFFYRQVPLRAACGFFGDFSVLGDLRLVAGLKIMMPCLFPPVLLIWYTVEYKLNHIKQYHEIS